MGDKQDQPFQLSYNASLKVDFQDSRVTSDGGLILVRGLDERPGSSHLIEQHLSDPRQRTSRGWPRSIVSRSPGRKPSIPPQRVVLGMDSTEIPAYGQMVPMIGKNCNCPRSSGNRSWAKTLCLGPVPPSPTRRFTKRRRSGARSTPSVNSTRDN